MLLWIAQAISSTAQNAVWYGILVLVQTRSHSSTQMGLAIMTLVVPSVLFGLIAGAYVDRRDKRAVLVVTCVLRAVISLGYIAFSEVLALVYLVNFAFSTVAQFFLPAEASLIPALVPKRQLMQANSLFHLTFTSSQLVGIVLLGPLVVNLVGVDGLFLLVAVLIGSCALLVWPLPRGAGAHNQEVTSRSLAGLRDDIREVARYMRQDAVVRLAILHWTLGATLGMVIAMLAPGFAENVLGVRAEASVFVLAPAGVGMVAGTVLLTRFGSRFDKHLLIELGLNTVALALITLGLLRPLVNLTIHPELSAFELPDSGVGTGMIGAVMLLSLVAGVGFVGMIVASQTIIQERVPVAVRGRVFAVQLVLSNLISIIPLVFLGGVADLVGVGPTMVALGVALLLAGLGTIWAHRQLTLAAA
jgi:MFS family permease